MAEFGENIWDISSWTSDIAWKDAHLRRHFDLLAFPECIKEVVDLAQTYFESVYSVYDDEEEEGAAEPDFPFLDILVLLTEEYLYGHFFHTLTPLQELQLLEILSRYFQENKLDAVRYLVFDCLFGLPGENLELQKGILEFKMTLMCKLTSMAVGTACGNVLNCIAVWLHNYGSQYGRGARVAYFVVNDYCFICPKAINAVRNLVNVSPVFAFQFAITVSAHFKEASQGSISQETLPPSALIDIFASWINNQPSFCSVKIPSVFLELPLIHKFVPCKEESLFQLCPMFAFADWCMKEPALRSSNDDGKAYSMLFYGILRFISSEKKMDNASLENSDEEIEPGELLDENDGTDLLSKQDVVYLVKTVNRTLMNHQDVNKTQKEEAINRLLQLLQVAKWAGCYDFPPKQLTNLLRDLPRTRLLDHILSTF